MRVFQTKVVWEYQFKAPCSAQTSIVHDISLTTNSTPRVLQFPRAIIFKQGGAIQSKFWQ